MFESNVSGQDLMSMSIYGAFENQHNTIPSPFSAKKVVHESDTVHPESHTGIYTFLIRGDFETVVFLHIDTYFRRISH